MAEVNYTPEQEAKLLAAAPFDLDGAKALAAELGKNYRSIIAKVKRMENERDEKLYIAKPAYTPKTGEKVESKADIVSAITEALSTEADLSGLVKADKLTLKRLREAVSKDASNDGEGA